MCLIKCNFIFFLFFKGSSWAIKLLQGVVPEVSHHLESPSAWLHPTRLSFLTCYVCVPCTEGMKKAKGLAKACPSCLDPPGSASEGIHSRNLHLSKARTRGTKQELQRLEQTSSHRYAGKNPQLVTQTTWFWCSPTLIPRFDLIFNTSFSLFMPSWKSHPFPGTLKLLPSKVSVSTCCRHSILTKAPYQKQSE